MADVRFVKTIFLEALELPDAVDRSAFLDKACRLDAALRNEVERLLRAHRTDDMLLEPNTRVEAEAMIEAACGSAVLNS